MRLLLYLTIVLLSVSFCGGVFAQTFEKQGDRGYLVGPWSMKQKSIRISVFWKAL